MAHFSFRSFCYGFMLAICLSYVLVFYLVNTDVLLQFSNRGPKHQSLLRPKTESFTRIMQELKAKVPLESSNTPAKESDKSAAVSIQDAAKLVTSNTAQPKPDVELEMKLRQDRVHQIMREQRQEQREQRQQSQQEQQLMFELQKEQLVEQMHQLEQQKKKFAQQGEPPRDPQMQQKQEQLQKQLEQKYEEERKQQLKPENSTHHDPVADKFKWTKEKSHIHWHDYTKDESSSVPWVDYMSRNLAIGIAVNTNPKNFAIFSASFRAYSPVGEAMVFINTPVSDRHWSIAEEHRIRIIEFDVKQLHPEVIRNYHPSSLRWILFDRLFHANNKHILNSFDKVIMVDIRDTMFQANPFKLLDKSSNLLYVFAEAPGLTIASCGWNSGWIKSCFGQGELSKVELNPILCSGVSMGTMDKASEYISAMSRTLLGTSNYTTLFPTCERNGVDQGVHNYLVHAGIVKVTQVHYEDSFPVVNAQQYDSLPVYDIEPHVLLSFSNKRYTIVHQYDRIAVLQSGLAKKYVNWVDMSNPKSEWASEESCANFVPVSDSDLFRGQCEYGSERTMSAASCCQACINRNILAVDMKATQPPELKRTKNDYDEDIFCTSFTFAYGVCYFKKCRAAEVLTASRNEQEIGKQLGAVSAYLKLPQI